MGWYIALGILVLLAIMPVGVSLIYQEDGLILSLLSVSYTHLRAHET